jgi:hypothetical protein
MTIRAARQPWVASGEPTCQIHAPAPGAAIFISDVSPTNVTEYIHWFHVTNEYIITFIGTDE